MTERAKSIELLRPTRLVVTLWLLTAITYAIQPQLAIGWGWRGATSGKEIWVLANLLLGLITLVFPGRILLAATSFLALVSTIAWHSWIGAIGAWTPWIMGAIAWIWDEPRPARCRAIEIALAMTVAAEVANRWNAEYLGGQEFGPSGQFSRIFPSIVKGWFSEHGALAARIWLGFSVAQIALFIAARKRAALILLFVQGLLATFLYNVIFYGSFLFVIMAQYGSPEFLSSWRRQVRGVPKPGVVYLLLQIGFFAQYLFFRESRWACWFLVVSLILVLALCRPPEWASSANSPSFRVRSFLFFLVVLLVLPLVSREIPSPFGATYFSAREARFPPVRERTLNRDEFENCPVARTSVALRWGYRIAEEKGKCGVWFYW